MNIFNNKKSTVGYFVLDNNDGTHKSLYKPVQQSFLKLVNCPAVSTVYKRMYDIFPIVSMNIKFGINDDEQEYYKYTFDEKKYKKTESMHNAVKQNMSVSYENDKGALQILTNHIFVTDDKDLEITVLPPENLKFNNCNFISGAFNIHSWLRPINAAFIQENAELISNIYTDADKPICRVLFNKQVDLKEITPTKEIIDYYEYMDIITSYHVNIKNQFKNIRRKRPKKFL